MSAAIIVVVVLVLLVVLAASNTIRIAQEYERGVVFRLGRLMDLKGPGLFFKIPGIDRVRMVDLRVITLEVPPQEVITSDNVTVKVNAVIFFQVVDAQAAIVRVYDFAEATSQIAQTTLRAVLGQSSLDELLGSRDKINEKLQTIIDHQTEPWGIKVTLVEVKNIDLPKEMQSAMARQAEAECERRAKVISAEGELQRAQKLTEASLKLAESPSALQLAFLQTLTEIAGEGTRTIIFPFPIDLVRPFLESKVDNKVKN